MVKIPCVYFSTSYYAGVNELVELDSRCKTRPAVYESLNS
jgi:hypothetical protein